MGTPHVVGSVPHHRAPLRTKLIPYLAEYHGFCFAAAFWYTDEVKKVPDAGICQDKFWVPGWSVAADTQMPTVDCQCPENIRDTGIQLSLSFNIRSVSYKHLRPHEPR